MSLPDGHEVEHPRHAHYAVEICQASPTCLRWLKMDHRPIVIIPVFSHLVGGKFRPRVVRKRIIAKWENTGKITVFQILVGSTSVAEEKRAWMAWVRQSMRNSDAAPSIAEKEGFQRHTRGLWGQKIGRPRSGDALRER